MPTTTASPKRAVSAKKTAAKKAAAQPAASGRRRKPAAAHSLTRRLPVGAEVVPAGVHFRVWAPRRKNVEIVFEGPSGDWPVTLALKAEKGGYFSGLAEGAGAGALYRFRLDEGDSLYPDPASRFQPAGPHGPSQVIDPSAYAWKDAGWKGIRPQGQVVYEMHVGTFTPEGTWE